MWINRVQAYFFKNFQAQNWIKEQSIHVDGAFLLFALYSRQAQKNSLAENFSNISIFLRKSNFSSTAYFTKYSLQCKSLNFFDKSNEDYLPWSEKYHYKQFLPNSIFILLFFRFFFQFIKILISETCYFFFNAVIETDILSPTFPSLNNYFVYLSAYLLETASCTNLLNICHSPRTLEYSITLIPTTQLQNYVN